MQCGPTARVTTAAANLRPFPTVDRTRDLSLEFLRLSA